MWSHFLRLYCDVHERECCGFRGEVLPWLGQGQYWWILSFGHPTSGKCCEFMRGVVQRCCKVYKEVAEMLGCTKIGHWSHVRWLQVQRGVGHVGWDREIDEVYDWYDWILVLRILGSYLGQYLCTRKRSELEKLEHFLNMAYLCQRHPSIQYCWQWNWQLQENI